MLQARGSTGLLQQIARGPACLTKT